MGNRGLGVYDEGDAGNVLTGLAPLPRLETGGPTKKRSIGTMLKDNSPVPQHRDKLSTELETMTSASYVPASNVPASTSDDPRIMASHDAYVFTPNLPRGAPTPRVIPGIGRERPPSEVPSDQENGESGACSPMTESKRNNGAVDHPDPGPNRVS